MCRREFRSKAEMTDDKVRISTLAIAADELESTDTMSAESLAGVATNDFAFARHLLTTYLERGGNVNASFGTSVFLCEDTGCALEGAIYTANVPTFELLIENGARLHVNAHPATLSGDFMVVPDLFYRDRMEAHGYITRRVLDLGGVPFEQQLRKFLFNACRKGATPVVSALLENGFQRRW